MIDVPIYNQTGEKIDTFSLDEAKLGGHINRALLKQALVYYHAAQRQGTVRTQARGEVSGSTRKMFRQKGTGNARTGGIRNPIKVGGGHAKQKRPKEWRLGMPKQMRRAATQNAILSKFQSSDVFVIDAIKLDSPKTKTVVELYKKLGIDRSCLIAINGENHSLVKSARNISRTKLTTVEQLNAWDILRSRTLVMTKDGLEQLLG